ncbi:hydantoinase B/oxoprolinase family protein [Pseudomonas typographi]|uniref:Hydantoinase B/oxoprolinase family protein n=1 Tax=Pseudomonas typographi TaxID=2715964 RepID=A0ABR7Z520_9PSED|nr:hydantoinase B/oxoprolinase family protein [Pseudomonas typographi]MBD1553042.1 hydantoinase B/oxoprolinase family protein [Pseudomonas typographi]MBD1588431.1 hydantoinase B/oxoprolinase family protein [Pseudomonas typographi]MBD1600494.1 hydantoinase B/oxoprolinase family protein [Pseudomonas typographi]
MAQAALTAEKASQGNNVLDPVTIEIMWTRVVSIVDEAARVIARTAFSTLSNDANDFACVLTDVRGQSLAQNTSGIPSFIATLPATVRHMLAEFPIGEMQPGDVFITNDPWMGTGHLPDVCLVKPIFHKGGVVAFAATTSHVPDIGGVVRSIAPREIYEEGLRIPPTLFVRNGEGDPMLTKLIRANVRTPDQTLGDIWAQVAALEVMDNRMLTLVRDYDVDSLDGFADEIFTRSEKAMRDAIRRVPKGEFTYLMHTDGLEEHFELHVKLTIRDDEILVDYAGTSPQQPCAINCPLTYTYAMTAYAIRSALLPELPNNEGMFRPIKISVPEKSLLNPIFPVAVGARAATGHYVPALVFGALFQALPERVIAAPGSPQWCVTLTGHQHGERYACVLFFAGGLGARASLDGVSCLSWPSNISMIPVEVAERVAPVLFKHKRLLPGSGGKGRYRGGLGQEALIELYAEGGASVFFMTERTKIPAPGLAGGEPGALGELLINGQPVDSRAPHYVKQGTQLLIRTPGGGGYGEAQARSHEAIEKDRRAGYI